jgi:predicted nucleic acid-binding Zn ribbon protein
LRCGASDQGLLPDIRLLHGPGFYATDYGQGEQKPETTTPSGDRGKASDKGAKRTDAKTTKKTEPE